jgi:hypothetical protein
MPARSRMMDLKMRWAMAARRARIRDAFAQAAAVNKNKLIFITSRAIYDEE